MSSCLERMARKRSKEEESFRMVGNATKSQKFNSEWDVKAFLGVAGGKKTMRNSVQKGMEGLVASKVGEDVKRVVGDSVFTTVPENATMEGVMGWDEEWPWFSSLVEEQTLWGWFWFPDWDTGCMADGSYVAENEVLWDDDIWQLKDIKEIPCPSSSTQEKQGR
uniref:Uncharacterized protein n=1 Tax=Nelumbo nucifera TaxID=4432 RepID=A0A822YLC2_NELNU|nr:TPA_asm: hypothetical protein HUJ06_010636 [Nelumbo nucifera]